jgi:hypothetical protein
MKGLHALIFTKRFEIFLGVKIRVEVPWIVMLHPENGGSKVF